MAGPVETKRVAVPLSEIDAAPRASIAVFADGADLDGILEAHRSFHVQGFTTNPTLMRKAGVSDYARFARSLLAEVRDLPVSFEVLADEFPEMERQARIIAQWGENVYVKIPVTNTRGQSSRQVLRALSSSGIRVNVTAVLTPGQVREVCGALSPTTPAFISVFAGRIADTGRDPVPIVREAVEIAKRLPLVKVIWASPREVLNVYQAEECGCHIITLTKPILDKLAVRGKDLGELSRETVEMFYDDARRAGYSL